MKKIIFLLTLFVSIGMQSQAQSNENHFNAGLGLNGWGVPIYASYDWAFRGDFNLGVGASLSPNVNGGNDGPSGMALGAGAFTQWYADALLDIPSDFDFYAGGGVFYYTYDKGGDLDLRIFLGGRYYVNRQMAINLELGGGSALSGGKIGLSWRL